MQLNLTFNVNLGMHKNKMLSNLSGHSCLFRGKWCADCLMIDGLVGQCGETLTSLWKRDEGGTGEYPPPTLHVSMSLLYLSQSFVLDHVFHVQLF